MIDKDYEGHLREEHIAAVMDALPDNLTGEDLMNLVFNILNGYNFDEPRGRRFFMLCTIGWQKFTKAKREVDATNMH